MANTVIGRFVAATQSRRCARAAAARKKDGAVVRVRVAKDAPAAAARREPHGGHAEHALDRRARARGRVQRTRVCGQNGIQVVRARGSTTDDGRQWVSCANWRRGGAASISYSSTTTTATRNSNGHAHRAGAQAARMTQRRAQRRARARGPRRAVGCVRNTRGRDERARRRVRRRRLVLRVPRAKPRLASAPRVGRAPRTGRTCLPAVDGGLERRPDGRVARRAKVLPRRRVELVPPVVHKGRGARLGRRPRRVRARRGRRHAPGRAEAPRRAPHGGRARRRVLAARRRHEGTRDRGRARIESS